MFACVIQAFGITVFSELSPPSANLNVVSVSGIERRGCDGHLDGQGRAGLVSNVEMEVFFLTLNFHNEFAAGPVVGSVIGGVTNHMLSFRKMRARLRAPKCHPAWDRVKEH